VYKQLVLYTQRTRDGGEWKQDLTFKQITHQLWLHSSFVSEIAFNGFRVVAAGYGQNGGEVQQRRQQMVQTFSWAHFNKPID